MAKRGLGSTSMSDAKRRKICSLGGKAVQAAGKGHQYVTGSTLAKEAGRRGGLASQARRRARKQGLQDVGTPLPSSL